MAVRIDNSLSGKRSSDINELIRKKEPQKHSVIRRL
jgi:hypothetical protein